MKTASFLALNLSMSGMARTMGDITHSIPKFKTTNIAAAAAVAAREKQPLFFLPSLIWAVAEL